MIAPARILDIVQLALRNVVMHKVRSALTMLSILFGVWSVIAMLAINEGAGAAAERALRELGSNNIIVESVEPPQEAAEATAQGRGAKCFGLTHADARRLRSGNVPGVVRSVISHKTTKQARVGDRGFAATVIGTEPVYAQVGKLDIVAGRFISHADYLQRYPHCVLTATLARKLFAYDDPLGQTVRLGMSAEPYIVVGILSRLPRAMSSGEGVDPDNCVVIPLATERVRFGEITVVVSQGDRRFERVEVSQVILQMIDEKAVIQGARIIENLLKLKHDQEDYKITVPLELLKQQAKQRRLWNIMFIAIALISLLVGGIGIANIMLASVTERTREIGVRRAMGAKRRDITVQFLVEAVTLTTAGGLLGIGIGMVLPWLIRLIMPDLPARVTPLMVLLPLIVAMAVGLISGLWPALRAARLDPIDALRHE